MIGKMSVRLQQVLMVAAFAVVSFVAQVALRLLVEQPSPFMPALVMAGLMAIFILLLRVFAPFGRVAPVAPRATHVFAALAACLGIMGGGFAVSYYLSTRLPPITACPTPQATDAESIKTLGNAPGGCSLS